MTVKTYYFLNSYKLNITPNEHICLTNKNHLTKCTNN